MKKFNKKGFTLIELLVVIAIIGLLSTLAVVSLNSARLKARDARRMSDLKQISTAIELHMSETEVYPTNGGAGLTCGNNPLDNILAEADVVGTIDPLCATDPIFADTDADGVLDAGEAILLQSIPAEPLAASGETYYYEGDTDNYCISALLEGSGNYFVCINGSCFERAAQCTEDGA